MKGRWPTSSRAPGAHGSPSSQRALDEPIQSQLGQSSTRDHEAHARSGLTGTGIEPTTDRRDTGPSYPAPRRSATAALSRPGLASG